MTEVSNLSLEFRKLTTILDYIAQTLGAIVCVIAMALVVCLLLLGIFW